MRKMLHQEIPELLREEEVGGWRLFANRKEDLVGGAEAGEGGDSSTDF